MNRRRLEHTAREVLPFVRSSEFAISPWECGTTACAVGHECRSRFGQREGLTLLHDEPRFDGRRAFDAVKTYYEIDQEAANFLFGAVGHADCGSANSPAEVASRIESLLASESP